MSFFSNPTFGSSTGGLFGSSNTTQSTGQSSGLFGSTATQPSFGQTSFNFGQQQQQQTPNQPVKFQAVNGTDTIVKNGATSNINTLHQCITVMKEYENKSLEELRFEDYTAKRKYPQQQPQTGFGGGSIFGGSTQQTTGSAGTTGGLFGSTGLTSSTSTGFSTTGSTSLFGSSTQNKPLFGSTATTAPSTSLFGSTGTQAQTANKPLFGTTSTGFGFPSASQTTTTQSTGGLFGGTTSTFGTNAQQPTAGIFGATSTGSTTTGGLFGTSTFGQTAPTTNTTSSIFGNTQNKSVFPSFGATTATTSAAAATPFTFGTPTTTTATAQGSLFSTNAASAAKPFGSPFGSTSTTTTPTSGGGLFSSTGSTLLQNTQKPLFGSTTGSFLGFGSQPATSTAQPFGGFGTTSQASNPLQPQATTAQPAFSFGNLATSQTTSPFGAATNTNTFSPIGQATTTGFPSFGSATTTQPLGGTTTSGFFGGSSGGLTGLGSTTTQPTGGLNFSLGGLNTSLGGTASTQAQQQQQQQQQLQQQQSANVQQQILALVNSPYGSSPLFRNISNDFDNKKDILKPVNPIAQKSFMTDSTNLIKGGLSPSVKLMPKAVNMAALTKSTSLFEGLEDEEEVPCFVPRKNIKKLLLKTENSRRSSTSNSINSDKIDFLNDSTQLQQQQRVDLLNNQYADKIKNFDKTKNTTLMCKYFDKDQMTNDYTNISDDEDTRNGHYYENAYGQANQQQNIAGVILERPDYFTLPSIDDLASKVDNKGDCFVEDFSIGRVDYGCITFPGLTNVAYLNLDEIVQIRRKEVNVYPDENKKPPVGHGLNKLAEVTLHRIWPTDRLTKEPITDVDKLKDMAYEKRIEKATAEMGAEFVDYDMSTGSWIFRVKHFSKYGLDDSDEDDEDNTQQDMHKNKQKIDPKEMIRKQLKIIETRRMELAQQKHKQPQLNKQLNILDQYTMGTDGHRQSQLIDDDNDDSMLNPDLNGKDTLYPDLSKAKQATKSWKLYPTLNDDTIMHAADVDLVSKQKILNNLDLDTKDDEISDYLENDGPEASGRLYLNGVQQQQQQQQKTQDIVTDEYALNGIIGTSERRLNLLFDANNEKRERHLLNTFFGANDEMEDASEMDFFESNSDKKFGLDGNLKFKQQQQEQHLHSNTIKRDELEEENAGHSKTKLLNRFNRLKLKTNDMQPSCLPKYFKYSAFTSSGLNNDLKQIKSHKNLCQYINYTDSITYKHESYFVDLLLFNSRKFHVEWSNSLVFVNQRLNMLNTDLNLNLNELNVCSYINKNMDKTYRNEICSNLEKYLRIQLDNSVKQINSANSVPHYQPNLSNQVVNEFFKCTQDIRNNIGSNPDADNVDHLNAVWSLCECLWGNLDELEILNLNEKEISPYEINQLRKSLLSKWLANVSTHRIDREVKLYKYHKSKDGYLNAIFSLMSGNRLVESCSQAIDNIDYRLALLIAQAGSNSIARDMCKEQMKEWHQSNTDKFISLERLKLYAILSGEITYDVSSSKYKINVCESLDWKRQFGIHLWYNCLPVHSIHDALNLYERNVSLGYCKKPLPPYLEDNVGTEENPKDDKLTIKLTSNSNIYDTCYHLIKLFCDKTHSINDIIAPECHSNNLLDFRLSWHLTMALISLKYQHISSNTLDNLHDNYATQLQKLNMWHWSVFVLLHVADEGRREKTIKFYLNQNCTSSMELNDNEKFLSETLSIPNQWIYDAKALRAKYERLYENEAYLLIRASKWNQAHLIFLDLIAPNYLNSGKYGNLIKYLEPLSQNVEQIHKWNSGGKIYLDFLKLEETFKHLGSNTSVSDQQFADIHERTTSLATNIKEFDFTTPQKRSCCIKICKLLLKLFHIFIELNNNQADESVPVNYEINSSIIEKAINSTASVPTHLVIDTMRMLKAKYVYTAFKLCRTNITNATKTSSTIHLISP